MEVGTLWKQNVIAAIRVLQTTKVGRIPDITHKAETQIT